MGADEGRQGMDTEALAEENGEAGEFVPGQHQFRV